MAIGIAIEKLLFSIARNETIFGCRGCVGPHADELARNRMERIGGKVHEQQWVLLVVGHLVVARACDLSVHRRESHFSVLPHESSLDLAA